MANTESNLKKGSVTVDDVWGSIMADRERWQKEKRVRQVSFDEENQAFLFHQDETTPNYRYYITLDRIETPEKIVAWVNHLRHKNWFTREVMNDLFDCLERMGIVEQGLV